MKLNPNSMGLFYFTMGVLFTYLAIQSAKDGLWSIPTFILMVLATFDFAVSLRMFAFSYKLRKNKK